MQELSQRGMRTGAAMLQAPRIQPLSEVDVAEMPRLSMGDKELNRVLGGGAVSYTHLTLQTLLLV